MTERTPLPPDTAWSLRWPVRLTLWGMVAETLVRSFWPLMTVVLAVLAALMFGLQDVLPLEVVWALGVLALVAVGWAMVHGLRRMRWPHRAQALDRLDATLPGRPITAITDHQAIGAGDAESEAVWKAHVARMAERARQARAVEPDLKIARRDPFALRFVAILAFVMALMFGSVWRVASVAEMTPGGSAALSDGTAWEGWVEPPAHTGKPSLYLADIPQGLMQVPMGSRLTLRLYGEVGKLIVDETVSGRTGVIEGGASEPSQSFDVVQDGGLSIRGPGGAEWQVRVIADTPPEIAPTGDATRTVGGEMKQEFTAKDDYGVVAGQARMELDLATVDRRYGLTADPEPREAIIVDLPLSVTGDRREFTETITENFAQHPWAGLPVFLTLEASDAAGQTGQSVPVTITLPGRRFFDTMAMAIVEQRRDLLWTRGNAGQVAQVLRAVSYRPDDIFTAPGVYLKLRTAIRQLENGIEAGPLTDALRDETAEVLWQIAVEIEDGNLSDALERLRRAQDRLAEAIKNGATDEEIAQLMDELRDAMQDYMRQLAENADPQDQQQAENQDMQTITGQQMEQLLQRLQELMEQGRTAEAQELLDQLRQMMENMQVTQGQGQQGPGDQAMQGLQDTLREQQELSDDTFGDLQEQFGRPPGQQPGQQGEDGQQGQNNQPGEQGQPGQPGQGQNGQGQSGQGTSPGQMLAERQQQLRDMLGQQEQNMPGAGSQEGDAAREALGRAGRAMDNAEDALRQDDLAGALDNQAEAMEALREGMRDLGEMMAQQQQQGQGQQGDAMGQADRNGRRDPLGRDQGSNGRVGTDEQLLQGDDVYRRARDLLDEIRRRSSDQERPSIELDYLKRLLDRF